MPLLYPAQVAGLKLLSLPWVVIQHPNGSSLICATSNGGAHPSSPGPGSPRMGIGSGKSEGSAFTSQPTHTQMLLSCLLSIPPPSKTTALAELGQCNSPQLWALSGMGRPVQLYVLASLPLYIVQIYCAFMTGLVQWTWIWPI